MSKKEYLDELRKHLHGLDEKERQKSIDFYDEVICDAIEVGKTEEEAVASLGSAKELSNEIYGDKSFRTLIKGKISEAKEKSKNSNWLMILLVIIGFPVWFPILIAIASIILAVYIVIWSLVVVIFSIMIAFAASGLAGVIGGVALMFTGNMLNGFAGLAAGLILLALAIFSFYPGVYSAKCLVKATFGFIKYVKKKIFKGKGK